MSYQKVKSESYSNIGGIDQKASIYKTGEMEVLDLVNYDFSEPGSWTKRWGSTGSLISGNTLTTGASSTINDIWSLYRYVPGRFAFPFYTILLGHSQGVFGITGNISSSGAGTTYLYYNILSGFTAANWTHVNQNDVSFFSPGGPFYKYSPFVPINSGATTFSSNAFYFGMAAFNSGSGVTLGSSASFGANAPLSGTYSYQFAYMDSYEFIGPRSSTYTFSTAGATAFAFSGFTTGNAASFGYLYTAVFRNEVPGFATTDMVLYDAFFGATWSDFGVNYIPGNSAVTPEFQDPITALNTSSALSTGDFYMSGTIIENYNNRLFFAVTQNFNTSSNDPTNPYKIFFSELGNTAKDLQQIYPENFFILPSQNLIPSGLKTFNQSLMLFAQKGVFKLNGNSPDNFNLQTICYEYGCISNKAIVEFKSKLWFLDETGIVEWNGASYILVSQKMQNTFNSMNVAAAQQTACAMHVPERNEVWFAIPTGTSTINNTIVVFDYLVNAWTTFSGNTIKPTALASVYDAYKLAANTTVSYSVPVNKKYFYGSIGASLYYFGPSFTSDNGSGITLSFQTRWHESFGKSVTNQFRRFFLDTKVTNGQTQTFSQTFAMTFYSNYVSLTPALTVGFNTSTLTQNWIDFGIPAKSLSANVAYGSTTGTVKVYGYTVESRFQRDK